MFRAIANLWLKRKTNNFTEIPLFTMIFNYQKYKEQGKEGTCTCYFVHPDVRDDEYLKERLQECVDHIRDTYDMDIFTHI